MRKMLIAAAMLSAFSMPALAEDMMTCDEAAVMKAEEHAKGLTGNTMDMAMEEVGMAKTAMKDGKSDECAKHLEKAMKTM